MEWKGFPPYLYVGQDARFSVRQHAQKQIYCADVRGFAGVC